MKVTHSARRGTRRILAGLGATCTALGTIGIFVPGLPTTVFLLLASYFFARSSPSLHRRLHAHPRLGPYLAYASGRRMPTHAKLVALGGMWGGIALSMGLLGGRSGGLSAGILLSGLAGTVAILLYGGRRSMTESAS